MKFLLVFMCLFFFGDDYLVNSHELPDLSDTTPEKHPFHAVVHAKMVCGGILLTENYVLTPAYCVYGSTDAKVYLGFHGYPYFMSHHTEPKTQILHSAHIFIHDDFAKLKDQHYLNNVALVKLSQPATFSDKVKPGKLISRREAQLLEGRFGDISGWLVSVDENMKSAKIQIRNYDTCSFLFGYPFLKSQEFCIKWFTKTRLNLLGNAVRVDDKIIGFQTNTPPCIIASSSCSRNDMVLNFAPFLDWMSDKMNVPVEQFTSSIQEAKASCDLSAIEDSINKINEVLSKEKNTSIKHDGEIANLNIQIQNVVTQLQQIRSEQTNFALTLNEQIGALKSEINNSRLQTDQNVVKLQEELNGVRTEMSNGLTAQKALDDLEARFTNLTNSIESKMNVQLNEIEAEIKDLITRIKNNQIEENQHFNQHEQEIKNLHEKLNDLDVRGLKLVQEIDEQFSYLNVTIKDVLSTQDNLLKERDDIRDELKIHVLKEHAALTKVEETVNDIVGTVAHNSLKENIRFGEIERVFGEQRNDMDKHIIQETAHVHSLWAEIKSLNGSVHKLSHFIYDEPVPN